MNAPGVTFSVPRQSAQYHDILLGLVAKYANAVHFHMLYLAGVYIDSTHGSGTRFRWVKAPTHDELTQLTHSIAQRAAHYLERQRMLVRDGENSFFPFQCGGRGADGSSAGKFHYLPHRCGTKARAWMIVRA